jgi:hypothetical protein
LTAGVVEGAVTSTSSLVASLKIKNGQNDVFQGVLMIDFLWFVFSYLLFFNNNSTASSTLVLKVSSLANSSKS